jgi:hypothetical protein
MTIWDVMDIEDNINSVQITSTSLESSFLCDVVFDMASLMVQMENAKKWQDTTTAEHT